MRLLESVLAAQQRPVPAALEPAPGQLTLHADKLGARPLGHTAVVLEPVGVDEAPGVVLGVVNDGCEERCLLRHALQHPGMDYPGEIGHRWSQHTRRVTELSVIASSPAGGVSASVLQGE